MSLKIDLYQGGRSSVKAQRAFAKSLELDENPNPKHTLFCRDKNMCPELGTIWTSLDKKSAFLGQKQCSLGKKCTITGIYCILY